MSANTVVVLIVGFLLALVMLLPLMEPPSAASRADERLLGIGTPPPVLALTPQPDDTD